jgi:hypothetical protein
VILSVTSILDDNNAKMAEPVTTADNERPPAAPPRCRLRTGLIGVVLGALGTVVKFGVYHAVSWPGRRRWCIDATIDELGYQPEHDDVPELADAAPATCSGRGQAPA